MTKEEFINKAYQWLRDNYDYYYQSDYNDTCDYFEVNEFIEDFHKAMEEQL